MEKRLRNRAATRNRLAEAPLLFLGERLSPIERSATFDSNISCMAGRYQSLVFSQQAAELEPRLAASEHILLARRGAQVLIAPTSATEVAALRLGSVAPKDAVKIILQDDRVELALLCRHGTRWRTEPLPALRDAIREEPAAAVQWLASRQPVAGMPEASVTEDYFSQLGAIVADLGRLDFYALADTPYGAPAPFDMPDALPKSVPAEPRRHAAVLLHNNYYHFNCLAAGLRKRGWDVVTVSAEAPDSAQRLFYHGEDINLFDSDPAKMRRRTAEFFQTIPERFGALHFYGMGLPSFFASNYESAADPARIPWDFLELRRHRIIIGYMPSGCMDGSRQSSIRQLTQGVCARCVWEERPDICSDARNFAWKRKLDLLCDWVGLELDHGTEDRVGPRFVYGPVVTALDPQRWRPDIDVPAEMRQERAPDDILVYHGVGNYHARRLNGRDIKGTGAVLAAVEQLRAEGLPLRLIFAHDVPSTQVRFLQVQADIVIDQLNYGRYGANAREAMMLAKPVICRLSGRQAHPLRRLAIIDRAPMRDADEATVAQVLRELALDGKARAALGAAAREHAVAWHGEDACAARYEAVIERIRAGLPPDSADLYPGPLWTPAEAGSEDEA